jgi:hypothetical protein
MPLLYEPFMLFCVLFLPHRMLARCSVCIWGKLQSLESFTCSTFLLSILSCSSYKVRENIFKRKVSSLF